MYYATFFAGIQDCQTTAHIATGYSLVVCGEFTFGFDFGAVVSATMPTFVIAVNLSGGADLGSTRLNACQGHQMRQPSGMQTSSSWLPRTARYGLRVAIAGRFAIDQRAMFSAGAGLRRCGRQML